MKFAHMTRRLVVFNNSLVVSVLIILCAPAGTLPGLPPMQQVPDFGEFVTDS